MRGATSHFKKTSCTVLIRARPNGRKIDCAAAKLLYLLIVLDSAAAHRTAELRAWLATRPRSHLHVPPTSPSSLNLVECVFAEITSNRTRRGTFTSVNDIKEVTHNHLERRNVETKPFFRIETAAILLE